MRVQQEADLAASATEREGMQQGDLMSGSSKLYRSIVATFEGRFWAGRVWQPDFPL